MTPKRLEAPSDGTRVAAKTRTLPEIFPDLRRNTVSQPNLAGGNPGATAPPLSESIWDVRLQAIWIGFTGIYLILAEISQARWLSSLALTIAGVLVILLLAQSAVSLDKTASRKTLLVAFGAFLFIVQKSYSSFHDDAGSVFAGICAVALLIPLWLRDDNESRLRLSVKSILFILSAVVLSLTQLGATIIVKTLTRVFGIPASQMLIAPHVVVYSWASVLS